MTRNPRQEPTLGARMLEIVVGTIILAGIFVIIIGFSLADLITAYETGWASFPKSPRSPVSSTEKPFLFVSIVAFRIMFILLGLAGAAGAFSVFFLRKPPVRW